MKQYNVVVDPNRLRAQGITLAKLREAIRSSNADAGGRSVELFEFGFVVRGRAYLKSVADIGSTVLKTKARTPLRVKDVARVELGPAERQGINEMNGDGEVAGGIILRRVGANALNVRESVKARLAEVAKSLPSRTEILRVYDRSHLIEAAIETLKGTLIEESVIVAFVCVVFLLHVRSAIMAGLLPILLSTGSGSEVMQRIAVTMMAAWSRRPS